MRTLIATMLLSMRLGSLASRVPPRLANVRAAFPAMMSTATADAPATVPTLDERLVGEQPDLVKQTLTMRRAAPEQLAAVDRIGELTRERSALVVEGNDAREVRKKLSAKIGGLMKEGKKDEAEAIKAEVAEAAKTIDAADEKMEVIEAERTSLFNTLPNLLDPRVNDGDDEEANFEVRARTQGFPTRTDNTRMLTI